MKSATAASLVLSTALTTVLAVTTAVPAQSATRDRVVRSNEVRQGPLAVSVKVGSSTAPLYQAARRIDRWYIEAREGANYEVKVRNTTGRRVGFLIAVDGLNAINGERTALSAHEPLYVLDPYATTTVRGWRKNLGNVSRFLFVDEQRSYAERTGQANGDMGWIRVLAFHEQPEEPYLSRLDESDRDRVGSAAPKPTIIKGGKQDSAPPSAEGRAIEPKASADAAPQDAYGEREESSPGTGWGKNAHDRARWVDFEPQTWAAANIVLRYEYKKALVTLGILPYRDWNANRLWERENGTYGFAQPPGR